MFDADIEVPPELADCKCLMMAGHLATDGHSVFCLGRIREYTMEVAGVVHTNDLCFCVWAPAIEDNEFRVVSHAINDQDMEWLHLLLHAALGEEINYEISSGSDLGGELIRREESGGTEET